MAHLAHFPPIVKGGSPLTWIVENGLNGSTGLPETYNDALANEKIKNPFGTCGQSCGGRLSCFLDLLLFKQEVI